MEKSHTNGQTVLVKAKASKPGQRRVRRKADAQGSLLSGVKQSVTTADGEHDDVEEEGYRQGLNVHGVLESDYEEEQFEAEALEELRQIQEKEGDGDEDYEEDDGGWRSSSVEVGERARTRTLRSRASVSMGNTPVKVERRGKKRARVS